LDCPENDLIVERYEDVERRRLAAEPHAPA
jgi:hypothetical protein